MEAYSRVRDHEYKTWNIYGAREIRNPDARLGSRGVRHAQSWMNSCLATTNYDRAIKF